MKKSFKYISALLILIVVIFGGSQINCRTDISDLYNKKTLQNTDLLVAGIENNDSLTEMRKFLPDTSAEGGEALFYFDGDMLSKINVSYFGEMGNITYKYYFDENELIFSEVKEVEYNMPIYVEGSEIANETNSSYYFKKENLIKMNMEDVDAINRCGEEYADWENRLLTEVEFLENLIVGEIPL